MYTSLSEYLHAGESELLREVQETDGLDKNSHNKKSNQIASILTKGDEQRIVLSPEQSPEYLRRDVDVVVHMGCHSVQTPHIVDATVDVLESLGMTTVPLGGFNNCCGILDFENGDLETAERVDDNRFSNIEAFDPEYAITECTSCFATSDRLSMSYREPEEYEFKSMIEFLHERRDELADLAVVDDPITVTLHDHYDGYGWTPLSEAEFARELFSALPGVEIVEMEHHLEDGLPCNFYSDLSEYECDDLTEKIYTEAAETGADLLINFWHACHRNMAVYDPHFPLETRNYTNFIGERLGFEYRDKTKEYKLAARRGDIEWILRDAGPVLEANGVDQETAEAIITEYLAPQTFTGC